MQQDPDTAALRELADRMMRIWLHSGGIIAPMFSNEAEEQQLSDTLGPLVDSVNRLEALRLRQLGKFAYGRDP